jgi:putative transposase
MPKPYSIDLRERVVAAVETGKLSRRQAAARFGVGVSTAINWVRRFRETGSVAPGQMGGHKPKAIRGENRAWLVDRIHGEQDFTLRGLVAELAERGLKVDYHTVWTFVHDEKLSFKKNRGRQRTGSSRRRATAQAVDEVSEPDRSRAPGLHRRDMDQDQHGAAQGMGATRPQAPGQGAARPMEDHDVPGGAAP